MSDKPSDQTTDDDDAPVDLRPWGYAPGHYSTYCADCQQVTSTDKRAWRCFRCANAAAREDADD